jgi:hypothetical protein
MDEGARLYVVCAAPACLVLRSIGTRPIETQVPAELDELLQLCFMALLDWRGEPRGRKAGMRC